MCLCANLNESIACYSIGPNVSLVDHYFHWHTRTYASTLFGWYNYKMKWTIMSLSLFVFMACNGVHTCQVLASFFVSYNFVAQKLVHTSTSLFVIYPSWFFYIERNTLPMHIHISENNVIHGKFTILTPSLELGRSKLIFVELFFCHFLSLDYDICHPLFCRKSNKSL